MKKLIIGFIVTMEGQEMFFSSTNLNRVIKFALEHKAIMAPIRSKVIRSDFELFVHKEHFAQSVADNHETVVTDLDDLYPETDLEETSIDELFANIKENSLRRVQAMYN